jgi:hypothetical protein
MNGSYLTYKIEANAEAGSMKDALAYKWIRTIEEDTSRRSLMLNRIEELHKQTYRYQLKEAA